MMLLLIGWKFDEVEGKSSSTEKRISYLYPDLMFRSTYIAKIKTDYLMDENLHFKGFVQINSAIKKKNVQLLCSYIILPPIASVQFGYQIGDPWFGVAVNKNQQVFLKLSGSF